MRLLVRVPVYYNSDGLRFKMLSNDRKKTPGLFRSNPTTTEYFLFLKVSSRTDLFFVEVVLKQTRSVIREVICKLFQEYLPVLEDRCLLKQLSSFTLNLQNEQK